MTFQKSTPDCQEEKGVCPGSLSETWNSAVPAALRADLDPYNREQKYSKLHHLEVGTKVKMLTRQTFSKPCGGPTSMMHIKTARVKAMGERRTTGTLQLLTHPRAQARGLSFLTS